MFLRTYKRVCVVYKYVFYKKILLVNTVSLADITHAQLRRRLRSAVCDKIMTAHREALITRDVTPLSARGMDLTNKYGIPLSIRKSRLSPGEPSQMGSARDTFPPYCTYEHALYSQINLTDTGYSLTDFCFYYKLSSSRVGG